MILLIFCTQKLTIQFEKYLKKLQLIVNETEMKKKFRISANIKNAKKRR